MGRTWLGCLSPFKTWGPRLLRGPAAVLSQGCVCEAVRPPGAAGAGPALDGDGRLGMCSERLA